MGNVVIDDRGAPFRDLLAGALPPAGGASVAVGRFAPGLAAIVRPPQQAGKPKLLAPDATGRGAEGAPVRGGKGARQACAGFKRRGHARGGRKQEANEDTAARLPCPPGRTGPAPGEGDVAQAPTPATAEKKAGAVTCPKEKIRARARIFTLPGTEAAARTGIAGSGGPPPHAIHVSGGPGPKTPGDAGANRLLGRLALPLGGGAGLAGMSGGPLKRPWPGHARAPHGMPLKGARREREGGADPKRGPGPVWGKKARDPFPPQRQAAGPRMAAAEGRRGAIIGDSAGLGKTRVGAAAPKCRQRRGYTYRTQDAELGRDRPVASLSAPYRDLERDKARRHKAETGAPRIAHSGHVGN